MAKRPLDVHEVVYEVASVAVETQPEGASASEIFLTSEVVCDEATSPATPTVPAADVTLTASEQQACVERLSHLLMIACGDRRHQRLARVSARHKQRRREKRDREARSQAAAAADDSNLAPLSLSEPPPQLRDGDGRLPRPRGRAPNGMAWDDLGGRWVPDTGSIFAAAASSAAGSEEAPATAASPPSSSSAGMASGHGVAVPAEVERRGQQAKRPPRQRQPRLQVASPQRPLVLPPRVPRQFHGKPFKSAMTHVAIARHIFAQQCHSELARARGVLPVQPGQVMGAAMTTAVGFAATGTTVTVTGVNLIENAARRGAFALCTAAYRPGCPENVD